MLRVLFLLLAVAPVVCAQAAPPKVLRITFEGNKRYTDAYLREQIATKVGQPLDPGLLTRDSRILREYFAMVLDIRKKKVEGGVEIVFEVLDQLLAGKVTVKGSAIPKSDYEPLLSTRRRRPLLDYSVNSDKDLLERLHREKGYYFVTVIVHRKPAKQANVEDVLFQVLPNRQVKVVEVILEGAHSIDRADLLEPLQSPGRESKRAARDLNKTFDGGTVVRFLLTPFRAVRNLFDSSYYRRETVEADRRRLEAFYRDAGFLDARVVLVEVRFDEKRRDATVHYRIDEGPRYRVRKFAVTYDEGGLPAEADREFLSEESLQRLGTLKAGDPYRGKDAVQSRRAIRERLWSRAYARSSVGVSVTPVAGKHEVDVEFVCHAGSKVRLGRIRIVGNRWTRDNVIRRQFRDGARPGDFLDIEALQAGQQRLTALRFFQSARFARGRQWGLIKSANSERPDEYDVEIEVEELDRTRQLQVGGSVDTDGGATAQVSVTWRNFDISRPPKSPFDILDVDAFRGGGQEFTIELNPGTRNSTFAVSFREPSIRDSRWSLHTRIFRSLSSQSPDYDLTTDGIIIQVGRFLDPKFKWHLSAEWSLRQVLLDDPEPDAPLNAIDHQGHSVLNSIRVALRRTNRRETDSFLNGYVSNLSVQLTGSFLGGDVDLFKLHFDHSIGWKLWRTQRGNHRVRVRFEADWARAFDSSPEVPIFERFFLGGRNLRGFEFLEAGPRSNGRPSGGEFRLLLSTEYTIPLIGAEDGIGVDLVLFVDQGGISTDFDSFDADSWRISAGFGLAVSFSLGGAVQPPLLIDFGFALRSRPDDRERLISVSFVRLF